MVEFDPPTTAPSVAGMLKGPETVNVEVATPATPAPPVEKRRLDCDGCELVARPVYTTVVFDPPTSAPCVPESAKGPEKVWEVVATERTILPCPR